MRPRPRRRQRLPPDVNAGSACAMPSRTATGTVSAPPASGLRLIRRLRRALNRSDSTEATDMPSAAPTSV